jgi:hypothetical protein
MGKLVYLTSLSGYIYSVYKIPFEIDKSTEDYFAGQKKYFEGISYHHFFFLKKNIISADTANIIPRIIKYPDFHPSSGIFSKFIP